MKFSVSDGRLLITGASGFVGGYVLKALSSVGIRESNISVISQHGGDVLGAGMVYNGDITDTGFVDQIIQEVRPTAVIHLAAIAEPSKARNNPDLGWKVNVEATRHLASRTFEENPDARFIFSGSSESYGATFNAVDGPITEGAALLPNNFYASTKAICDVLLGQLKRNGCDIIRFRAFNHSGPGQIPNYVIPAFAQQIAKIESNLQAPEMSVGNLDAERDFCDVADIARAYAMSLSADISAESDAAYNLCSGCGTRIQDLVDELLRQSKCEIKVTQDPEKMRPSEVPSVVGSGAKASRELNWQPNIPLKETLLNTLNYYRSTVAS